MASHNELLNLGPREAPEPETAEERNRLARPARVAVTVAGVGAAIAFVAEFLRYIDHDWWVGPLFVVATTAGLLWDSRNRIREWWENQP
jgi:fatty acid desaturase